MDHSRSKKRTIVPVRLCNATNVVLPFYESLFVKRIECEHYDEIVISMDARDRLRKHVSNLNVATVIAFTDELVDDNTTVDF